jgi:hypothetical protein
MTGAGVLHARLSELIQDLADGRLTTTEANRITKQATRKLRKVESAIHAERLARALRSD